MIQSMAPRQKDIYLLYAAKTEPDLAFRQEIETIQQAIPTIKIKYILSKPAEGFEGGYVDKEKIVRLVPDFYTREVFLCGPPIMMASGAMTTGIARSI